MRVIYSISLLILLFGPKMEAGSGYARADESSAHQDATPNAKTVDEQFRLGTERFNKGEYKQAIRAIEAAYALQPEPEFLFNLAQAHRKAGHAAEAVRIFKHYLQANPGTPQREEVENYIAALQARLEAETAQEQRRRLLLSGGVSPQQPVVHTPVYKKAWFWALVGAAVVGAGAGAGAGIYLYRRDPPSDLGTVPVMAHP